MLAKVTGVFRLSQDVELKFLPSGAAVAKLNLVNGTKYKTQSGEQKEETCFIEGVAFGKPAEIMNQYLTKGSKVFITGELSMDSWSDQQGNKRTKHKIKIDGFEFLDSKPQGDAPKKAPKVEVYDKQGAQQYDAPSIDISEDEIPFS